MGLDDSEAAVLAALLTGARFSIESPERVEPDDLSVRTVSLGSRSPLLGRPVTGLALPGGAGEATILAVVRGDEAFVDPSTVSVLQAGDRLVVAAPRRLHEALEELGG
ncbi:MAG: hypothetical protein M5U14_05580 [Acidimicrobiia bacterium]|nr:hypothetical protein [Acidimicrobiia bacterium]